MAQLLPQAVLYSRRAGKLVLLRELGELARAGEPLSEALRLWARHYGLMARLRPSIGWRPAPRGLLESAADRLEQGAPLSEALWWARLIDRRERTLLEIGETNDDLAGALRRLAEFQSGLAVLDWRRFLPLYSLFLATVTLSLSFFILIILIPKLLDIYAHMSFPVPSFTLGLVDIVRRYVFFVPLLFYLPVLIQLLLYFGAPALAFARSRWLAAFSLALEGGIAAPEATRLAGQVAGGRARLASHQASEKIEQGYPIGQALAQTGAPDTIFGHRLNLINWQDAPSKALRSMAEDAAFEAEQRARRWQSIFDMIGVVHIAVLGGLLAASVYLPLFHLSQAFLAIQ